MTDPCPLSDADLLAWAVALEYRRRQTHEGLKILLLAFPPCPTCKEPVTEAQTWWIQDPIRYDGVIVMQPCGHSHSATASDMERIHDHATQMLEQMRWDGQYQEVGSGWGVERVVAEARARVGESDATAAEATEATEPDKSPDPRADALAAEWHRRNLRLEELTQSEGPEAQVAIVEHVRGELAGLRGALGILLGGQVQDGTADLLGWAYCQEWRARQEGQA